MVTLPTSTFPGSDFAPVDVGIPSDSIVSPLIVLKTKNGHSHSIVKSMKGWLTVTDRGGKSLFSGVNIETKEHMVLHERINPSNN